MVLKDLRYNDPTRKKAKMTKSNVVLAITLSLILMATASSSTTGSSHSGVSPACTVSTNQAQCNNGKQVESKVLNASIVIVCNSDGTTCCIVDPEGRPPICIDTALRPQTEHASLRSNVLEKELKELVSQSNR